ncbi:MAG: PLP-dependent transferase, partial [Cellulomonadaceae bacterium]
MSHASDLSPETLAVVSGRPARAQGQPVNPPIVLTSTYFSRGVPDPGERLYARWDTESWNPLEQAVAELEGATLPGLVFGSGMAAIAAALSLVPGGGKIVAARHSYQGVLGLLQDRAASDGTDVVLVDVADTQAVVAALEGADLLWIESPTNPMLEVADVPALVAAAHAAGALAGVDNTFATPLLQRPLAWGADLVAHSVTKYLSGHSDVVLGMVVTNDGALRERLQQHRTLH